MFKPSIVLGCICAVGLGLGPARAVFAADRPVPVRAFLCDTSAHAVLFADVKARGEGDEIAKDRVGRMARADVCGLYAGVAAIESQSVTLNDGVVYKLTAFRFVEDRAVGWLAETTFAPPHSGWDL